jgi:hypothetical protein
LLKLVQKNKKEGQEKEKITYLLNIGGTGCGGVSVDFLSDALFLSAP